ncbi:MAG: hypothetical protein ACR2MQ_05795 [Gemmatimonadaceae bacterium]
MRRKYFVRSTLTGLGLAILGVGCAPEAATAPQVTAAPSLLTTLSPVVSLVPTVLNKILVPVVSRRTALSHDITVTKDIGPDGGTLKIDEAGLTVKFAPGAVPQITSITATAYAGHLVSYGFGPHGIHFAAPVTIVQDASKTTVNENLVGASTLFGAYTPDGPSDITADGRALVSELRGTQSTVGTLLGRKQVQTVSFVIEHFSGYILMGGRH